jgi:type II secretion system protein N
MELPQIALSPRLKKILIWSGYPTFALFVVVVTIFASLPRDRIKDKLETGLSADPMSGAPMALGVDVTIGELGLNLLTGLGLSASDIVVRTRPLDQNIKPARYLIEDVSLKVGLFGLMFGRPTYTVRAHALQGELKAKIGMSPAQQTIFIDAKNLVLTGVPGIQQAITLPVAGTISLNVDAVAAKSMAANLDGKAEITIEDFILGDGKAKLTVPGDPFMAAGITFPRLRFGTVNGQLIMEKGKGRIEGLHVKSPDGEAYLEGYIDLRDPLGMSQIHGYLRFKPSEALVKREPTVELMSNAMSASKRPDGFIGFQLSGPLSAIYYLPNQNPPPGVNIKGGAPTVPAAAPAVPSVPVPAPSAPPIGAPPTTIPAPPIAAPEPVPAVPPPPAPPPPTDPAPPPSHIEAPKGVRSGIIRPSAEKAADEDSPQPQPEIR